jgi:hypothetical protein
MKGETMKRQGVLEKIDFEKLVGDEGIIFSIGDPNGTWKVDLTRDDLENFFKTIACEFPDYAESKLISFVRQAENMMVKIECIMSLAVEELQRLIAENKEK